MYLYEICSTAILLILTNHLYSTWHEQNALRKRKDAVFTNSNIVYKMIVIAEFLEKRDLQN